MNGSFVGPRLKLDRAWAHREQLEDAVSAFTEAERQKVAIEHEAGTRLWVIDEPSEVPLEFGLLISDALHNLRSALDYLATQLVIHNNEPGVGLSGVGFPIFDNSTEYAERGLPMVSKMSDRVQATIEAAQPYHRPMSQYTTDRLLLLNRLNNAYKHSAFKLVALSIVGGGGIETPSGLAHNAGPLVGRTVLMAWPHEDPDVDVDWTFVLDIVFAEGLPWMDTRVCRTLREIEETTVDLAWSIAEVGELRPQSSH